MVSQRILRIFVFNHPHVFPNMKIHKSLVLRAGFFNYTTVTDAFAVLIDKVFSEGRITLFRALQSHVDHAFEHDESLEPVLEIHLC